MVLLLSLARPSYGQQGFELEPQSSSESKLSSAFTIKQPKQQAFLPVDKAYRPSISYDRHGLQIDWAIAPGYYLYKHRFGHKQLQGGQTSPLNAELEPGKSIYDQVFEQQLEVYYDSTRVLVKPQAGDSKTLTIGVDFQGCADAGLCYPPQTHWYALNPATFSATRIEAPGQPIAPASGGSFIAAIVFALLGGLILNLMPCVFPVLSIKALSLAEAGSASADKQRHGWAYTIGAVASFVLIAALMLVLKAGGQAIGWGFQLQSPVFVSLLAYLFFAMALSLAGLSEFGTRLMGIGQSLTLHSGYRGSFFTGVLAAVVASPCTAPFMGTALAFALGQTAAVALAIFAALGLGMALPFLLLSYLPGLGRALPKPGPWMETFKQFLAFPMLLAALWLLWVLGRQSGTDALSLTLGGLILIAFGFWLGRHSSPLSKWLGVAALLLALALPWLSGQLSVQRETQSNGFWQPYSEAKLEAALAEGRSVFINATAAWCLTCLANERIAFSQAFEAQLKGQNTLALKADWTNYDESITTLLQRHGRSGVPLYLFYQDGQVQILPQLLTEGLLLDKTRAN
ncbi:MAG: protein-disulfide reductase DsbD family protein [Cellvibrionaceae bacterium]|nr:protein-disulfide reductase DsbD family protein [Cellvibrionaceae bacterium]